MINEHSDSPSSLKAKLKSSLCCFTTNDIIHQHEMLHKDHHDQERNNCRKLQPQTPRSPYAWLKSTAHDLEIKDKYRGLIGKRGKNRKRHGSEDFRYDPESYSLNFEDDVHREDELPLYSNFKARLPATPERLVVLQPVGRTELELWG
ncbi:unnamed protein product [Dovyalis caffra]|uniref:Uncharacterized protein n=1 Tax=Dovyalis caffra TaxID=77055 RepID=A0AAV1SPU3_9ROSI|nr:unnamed protein product [Dovyalis caffra]